MTDKKTDTHTDEDNKMHGDDMPAPAKPHGSHGFLIVLMLVVAIQIAMAGYYAYEIQQQEQAEEQALDNTDGNLIHAVRSLKANQERIQKELNLLADQLNSFSPESDNSAMEDALSDLEARISNMELTVDTLDNTTLSDDKVEALLQSKQAIEDLQKQVSDEQSKQLRTVSTLAAIDQIANAISQSEPYQSSLSALQQSLQEQPSLLKQSAVLENYADGHAPSMESLQQTFSDAVDSYYRERDDQEDGPLSSITSNLQKLVKIRKVGAEHQGDDAASRIARAEAALQEKKLNAAIDEIRALPQEDAPYFYGWLSAARDYVSLRETVKTLRTQLHQHLQDAE